MTVSTSPAQPPSDDSQFAWLKAPYHFAGWVPTVMGHLAYSVIGNQSQGAKSFNYNRPTLDHASRVVAVYQKRTAHDYILPGEVLRHVRPRIAQDYILLGETASARTPYIECDELGANLDTQGALLGQVYIVPQNRSPQAKAHIQIFTKRLKALMFNENIEATNFKIRTIVMINDVQSKGVLVAKCNFCLFRTGELRLWFDRTDMIGHENEVTVEEETLIKLVPHQVYFFIKDATHRHYHHEPDSDQLLPLTKLSEIGSDADYILNEEMWRRETLWGLARIISQFRRRGDLYSLKKAKGVLAYAESFQGTLAKIISPSNLDGSFIINKSITSYDFNHAKLSIDALEGSEVWRKSGHIQLVAILIGVVLSSLALWAGAVQIYPILCNQNATATSACAVSRHEDTVYVVSQIVDHPLVFATIMIVLGILTYVFILRNIEMLPYGKNMNRMITQIVSAFGGTTARRAGDVVGWIVAIGLTLSVAAAFIYGMTIYIKLMLVQ